MPSRILVAAATLAVSCGIFIAAQAANVVPEPEGPVILEVRGSLSAIQGDAAGPDRTIRLDLAGLQRLPQRTVKTYTDWTDGPQTFEGVALKDVLEYVGAEGSEIRAVALNDYAVAFPASDAREYPVILAFKHNGKLMRIRDKGPIWIIYPSEKPSSHQPGPHNDKMVWQLRRLEIR